MVCETDVEASDRSRASDLDRRRRRRRNAAAYKQHLENTKALGSLLYLGKDESRAIVDSMLDCELLAAWK
jgi:hypothetical protein